MPTASDISSIICSQPHLNSCCMLLREGPVSIVFVRYMNPISFQLGITWVYSSERPPPWPCPPCGLSLAPMLTWPRQHRRQRQPAGRTGPGRRTLGAVHPRDSQLERNRVHVPHEHDADRPLAQQHAAGVQVGLGTDDG